jgi:quercetin dioxygenase-like cupin family protein
MPGFTAANLKEVEASSSAPPGLEARVARPVLGSEHLGVSYFSYEPGVRTPFGHSHGEQEEAYVVVAGSGRAKLDDEIVELAQWDVLRIAPGVMRAVEGGPEGLELIAIGSDQDEEEEVRVDEEFWSTEVESRTRLKMLDMDDAVSRYCAATEAGDVDAFMATMAPDVEVVSPISGRMVFRGQDDVRFLLSAVYGTLGELNWTNVVGDGENRVAVGETRIAGIGMTDAMVFELDSEGRIRRIGPHLRPWLALSVFALLLGPKVGRRLDVVRRALAAGS